MSDVKASWVRSGIWVVVFLVMAVGNVVWAEDELVDAATADAAAVEADATGADATVAETEEESELPEVTVLGQGREFTLMQPRDLLKRPVVESPGLDTAVSVVGRYEIEQFNAYSIVDAMKYVPGAWTESRGRKVKQFFSVRGQRYPYPGYTIDGAWFREFHETNYFMDSAFVERLEIVRSSSAMLLGPGGMTGMINIVPREFEEATTQYDLLYGSFGTWRTSLVHGDSRERFAYTFGASQMHSNGPSGENARENMTNVYARGSFKVTDELTVDLNGFALLGDRELQLAEAPASGTLQTRRDSFDPRRTYMFVGKARYEPSDRAATEMTINYANRRYYGERDSSSEWLEYDYEYGARLIQSLKLTEENTLRFGGMINHWETPTGKRFYTGRPGDLTTYSLVVADDHDFGKLDLNFGYRMSQTYIDQFGGFNIEGSAAGVSSVQVRRDWEDPMHTFTVGAGYDLSDGYSLHGNYTWGQIAAGAGMVNEDLQRPGSETRNKVDFGVRKIWEKFGQASVTAFYVRQDEAALLSGTVVQVDGDDFALYENGDRENYGVELDVRSKRFENGLQFFVNAVGMKTRRTDDGKWGEDDEVPEFILGGGSSYVFGDFELNGFVKHVNPYENERFLPNNTPSVGLGDYWDIGAKLAYYFGAEKQNTVFVRVDNMCNREYSTVVGYPDEGCRYMTGMSLRF